MPSTMPPPEDDYAPPANGSQQVILLGVNPGSAGELSLEESLALHDEVWQQRAALEAAVQAGESPIVLGQLRGRLRETASLLLPEVTLSALRCSDWDERAAGCQLAAMLAREQPHTCAALLPQLVPQLVNCIRDSRSALCLDGISAVRAICTLCTDALLEHLLAADGVESPAEGLLTQLMTRATDSDMRIIALAANGAVESLVEHGSPGAALQVLRALAGNASLPANVRGKAASLAAGLKKARLDKKIERLDRKVEREKRVEQVS